MGRKINASPHEDVEQTSLFIWAAYNMGKWPELDLMYHVPNGGSRHRAEAARLKAQGVKSGVPDVVLPVARGAYHGLYIEMKRQTGGTVSAEQKTWITALRKQGYFACVCKGWEMAAGVIEQYMEGKL